MNSSLDKTLSYMIYGSLAALAIGLVTSITIMALYHILMIIPIIYFLPKTNFREWAWSTWALAGLSIILVLSVLFNQDIAVNGYQPLSKIKYFIFGFLTIAPLNYYFKNHFKEKKINYLLCLFFIATSFATIVGIYSTFHAYNPVTHRMVAYVRNAGLFGMVMNYAHNLAFFQIILTGMIIYRKDVKRCINLYFLYLVFLINLVGLYWTYTRGAWLGFLLALPFFLLKNHKKWFALVILLIVLGGGIVYGIAGKSVIRPKSDDQRVSQWSAAFMAFKERPILGYGFLNFEHHSLEIKQRYDLKEKDFGGHAHSNFFEMLGSVGILGFISFMVWVITWFMEMYRRDDVIAKISLPFIIVFIGGGLTQSTVSLGVNLFFIIGVYSISQIDVNKMRIKQ